MLQVGHRASTGRGAVQAIAAPPSDAPQRPQNLVAAGCSIPQRVQRILLDATPATGWFELGYDPGCAGGAFWWTVPPAVTSWKVVLPQRPQNFAPAAKREPHFVHATTPGVLTVTPETLPRLPPCDGVNPLESADLNCA